MRCLELELKKRHCLCNGQERRAFLLRGAPPLSCLLVMWMAIAATSALPASGMRIETDDGIAGRAPEDAQSRAGTNAVVDPSGSLVEICKWQGDAAGAASVSVDDSYTSCRQLLNRQGFKGTYYLSGTDKFTEADWEMWRAIYAEGHELGGHTTSHVSCHILDEKTLRWELSSNRDHILTNVGMPEEELTSLAWPRGDCSPNSEAIASDYYLSARGYHINKLEDAAPANFMNLKSINTPHYHASAYDPPDYFMMADKAEVQGTWASFVFHNHSQDDGAIAYLTTKNLWVAPVGRVVKYVKERENSQIENVRSTPSGIAFRLTCGLDSHLFNQALTVRVSIPPGSVKSVLVNQHPAVFRIGDNQVLIDVYPSGRDEVVVSTVDRAEPLASGAPEPQPAPQNVDSRRGKKVDPGNGAVINIWISDGARLDTLRRHGIKYLFVDVGDTNRAGKIDTPMADIVQFLHMIKLYEEQHAYDFIMLPYSEINTHRFELSRSFRANVVADYKGLMALGFDGVYVDVEPVPSSVQQDYLKLLAELSELCSGQAIVGVYAGSMSESSDGSEQKSEWLWSRDLYHSVSALVDLIAIPGYDFNLSSRKEYIASLRKQIDLISSEVFECQFIFTLPTHKREPETIGNALEAYNLEIQKYPQHQFVGVCVFAEWTTIPEDWHIFESRTRRLSKLQQ